MGTVYLSTDQAQRSRGSQQRVWWFSLGFAVLLFCSSMFGLTSLAFGAQKHGCAPDVPPSVTGNPTPVQPVPGTVLINEALSQPKSNWNCSEPASVFSQENDSWIELYNPQSQPLNLYAAHTQISLDGGSTSTLLPFGSIIAAHGYLVIFPQEHQTVASPPPWNIILRIDTIIIDQAAIPLLQPDQSYARVPDGATTWLYAGTPTIAASNNSIDQPVTPTPTKTPKATALAGSSSGTAQPISFGTQPAWNGVQLPQTPTLTPTSSIITTINSSTQLLSQPQSPSTPQSNGPAGWLIALIVLLALLLLAALLWYRRLSRAP